MVKSLTILFSRFLKNLNYITALRFPLAVLVVLIHSYNSAWRTAGHEALTGWGTFCSQTLPTFAVPLFFAISGYLFFARMQAFSWSVYAEKLRRRVHTLLVPYVAWNIIAFLLYAAKDWAAHVALQHPLSLNLLWGDTQMSSVGTNLLGWTVQAATAPVQEPLWFVRDLIILVLLSPIVYWIIKCLHWASIVILATVYYLHLWPNPCGMSAMGWWFFSLGAWFAIEGKEPIKATRSLLRPCAVMLLPLLILQAILPDRGGWGFALTQQLYVLSAMVCAIHAADSLSHRWMPAKVVAQSSFFIYASHVIVLSPLTAVLAKATNGFGFSVQILGYLLCPALTVGICLALYAVLAKFLPKTFSPLLGR